MRLERFTFGSIHIDDGIDDVTYRHDVVIAGDSQAQEEAVAAIPRRPRSHLLTVEEKMSRRRFRGNAAGSW
jgi:hypothetical protein